MREELPSAAIGLDGVSKRFGKHPAVDDVTLEIGEGEFFSLLGPSGCGKTTTLRMVAGFELPDAGRIVLKGSDVTEVPANRRPVNMVFQQYALFPHMSVYDNVAFGLKVKRVPRAEHRERVQEMLRVVSLEGLDRRRARQLSGGREIYERPRTAFVADFIGSLNALDLRIDELVGENAVMRLAENERVVVPVGAGHRTGESLRVAVRPERVQIEPAGTPVLDGGSRLEGTIAEVVFLGMYTQFHVDTRAGRLVSHRLADEALAPLEAGSRVALSWEPEQASLLGVPGL